MKSTTRKRITAMALLAALNLAAAAPGLGDTPPVDINTATAAELETINGIGPAKARAIVDYREENGKYASVDDLRSVAGIGDKLLERMRPQVRVSAAEESDTKAEQKE